MDVRVLEAGKQQAARQVDDLGRRSGQRRELGIGPDGGDPARRATATAARDRLPEPGRNTDPPVNSVSIC